MKGESGDKRQDDAEMDGQENQKKTKQEAVQEE